MIYDLHAGNPRDVDLALAGNKLWGLNTIYSFKEIQFRRRKDFDIGFIIDGLEQNTT